MNEIQTLVEKLRALEENLSRPPVSKTFKFFGLFLREDFQKWDLIVSAQWLDIDGIKGIEFLVSEIKKSLNNDEILMLSRIVPYPTNADIPTAFAKAINANHSLIEVKDSNFFGVAIKHAYIITSN